MTGSLIHPVQPPDFVRGLIVELQCSLGAQVAAVGNDRLALRFSDLVSYVIGWRYLPKISCSPEALAWITGLKDYPALAFQLAQRIAAVGTMVLWCDDVHWLLHPRPNLETATDERHSALFAEVEDLATRAAGAQQWRVLVWADYVAQLVRERARDRHNPALVENLAHALGPSPLFCAPRALERLEISERALACEDISLAYVLNVLRRERFSPLHHTLRAAFPKLSTLLPEALSRVTREVNDIPFEGGGSLLGLGATPRRWRLPWIGERPSELVRLVRYLHIGVAGRLRAATGLTDRGHDVHAAATRLLPEHQQLRSVCEYVVAKTP